MKLVSESLSLDDYDEAVELFFERGWTDGLPVVLPTRRRVEAMIAHVGRDPQESLGPVPPKGGEATIEKLAINAVMGGCRPEHFPVALAAMEAMMDPAHNLNGVSQTTHMCVSLIIVNGPIARELGFNSRDGVFGNGYRANAAVGRAARLALWNLGGAVPWDTDKSTLSHPGEYAFCIAEEEEDNPWPPLHVERGCAPGSDAVTVFACEGPHSIFCYGNSDHPQPPQRGGVRQAWLVQAGRAPLSLGARAAVAVRRARVRRGARAVQEDGARRGPLSAAL